MLKVKPPAEYPPEEGRYLRGNDYSPVAVVVLLNAPYEKIPLEVERLVRVAVETGAALAGTLQTANIGLEKIVANVVANPNIRYLSKSQSLWQMTEAELSQIDKFELTEANLETEPPQ